MINSFEMVDAPKDENIGPSVPSALTRTYEYVRYQDALENLELPSENHLNEKKFLDKNDPETLYFEDEFLEAVDRYFPRESVKYVRFRGRKDKSFAAWLVLSDHIKESFQIDKRLLEIEPPPKVTAITLLNSNEVRLLRISLKGDGSRLYEVVNGSCKIKFAWIDGVRECRYTSVFHSDGKVDVVEACSAGHLPYKKDAFVRMGSASNPELTLKDIDSMLRKSNLM